MNQPILQPVPDSGRMMMFVDDWQVKLLISGRILSVKKGYTFDGTSAPELTWSLLGITPFDPDFILPAATHDPLYEGELLPRADCDREFREMLKANSVRSKEKSFIVYEGVRLGGWEVWNHHTPESIAAARNFCSLST